MFDRRLLTDAGLALLIALPLVLPAAPNPWTTSDEVGRPGAQGVEVPPDYSQAVRFAEGIPVSEARYGRS